MAKAKKPSFDPKAMVVPDALNGEAWNEWVDYRISIRKPITELSARKAVKMLTGYPHDTQQQIVDKSIQNGWQGLFPPDATRGRPVNQEADAERKAELMRGAAILAAYRRPKIKREW